jgi:hypothetical protein
MAVVLCGVVCHSGNTPDHEESNHASPAQDVGATYSTRRAHPAQFVVYPDGVATIIKRRTLCINITYG